MKKLVTSYTFDASAKTIDSADFTSLDVIQLITNVTDNIIIYNFADPAKGGSLSGTTLTLDYDTTSMDDADRLQIFVDAGTTQAISAASLPLPSGAATSAKQDTLLTELQAKADLTETQPVSLASVPSHAVTNAGTFAVQNTAATPAGTNNIGDVDILSIAAGDNNIGNVDIVTMPAITGSVTADTEMSAAAAAADNFSNPTAGGVLSFPLVYDGSTWDRMRNVAALGDAGTAALATGIYGYNGATWDRLRSDTTNGLDVDVTRVSGTVTVDGSGVTQPISHAALTELAAAINSNVLDVNIVSGAGSGGTAAADDADFTAGTTQGTPAMGVYDSTPDTVTDGDLGTIGINSTRAVRTVIEAGSAAIGKLAANSGVDIGDVDVTSSALPTGASTLAEQQSQTTHLATLAGAIRAEDAASADAHTGIPTLAVRKATPANTSGTDGDYEILQMSAGRLWTSSTIDAALPAGTNAIGKLAANSGVDIGDVDITSIAAGDNNIGNVDIVTLPVAFNTGTRSATTQRVTIATDDVVPASQSGTWNITNVSGTVSLPTGAATSANQSTMITALQLIDDTVFTDDAAFTVGTSKVNAIGLIADETSTDSIDEGDVGAPRMTLDRKQITTAYAHTAGGATPYKLISAATTNATNVKGSAGTLYNISATNINAAVRYLKLYNKATAPTVGTDTPVQVYAIPGNTAGAGTNIPIGLPGLEFGTGIGFAITTGAADSDTGAVAANEIVVNLGYK